MFPAVALTDVMLINVCCNGNLTESSELQLHHYIATKSNPEKANIIDPVVYRAASQFTYTVMINNVQVYEQADINELNGH